MSARAYQSSAKFPAPLAAHLAERVCVARRRYRKRLARCRRKISADAVHELRIEMRRILALLDLLQQFHFAGEVRKPRKVFKRCLDAFDDLRDIHVQQQFLKPLWPAFPEAREFRKLLRRQEKEFAAGVAGEIAKTKYTRWNRRLKTIEKCLCRGTKGREGRTAGEVAAAAAERTFLRVTALRELVRRSDPKSIHRLRIAFKRFRYLCESLQPFLPEVTTASLKRMRNYQGAAGEVQDLVVLLARLECVVTDGELAVRATKQLRTELLQRRDRAIDLFLKRIDDVRGFRPAGMGVAVANNSGRTGS